MDNCKEKQCKIDRFQPFLTLLSQWLPRSYTSKYTPLSQNLCERIRAPATLPLFKDCASPDKREEFSPDSLLGNVADERGNVLNARFPLISYNGQYRFPSVLYMSVRYISNVLYMSFMKSCRFLSSGPRRHGTLGGFRLTRPLGDPGERWGFIKE